jgi:citrate synthase
MRPEDFDGCLKTRMGAAFPGSRAVFRGQDLHADLKDMDWLELYVFGITGRRPTPAQSRLLQAIWAYTSYPDARLWNNRVAALAGSARSTPALGLSAALAVSEAVIYGGQAGLRAFDFLLRAKEMVDRGLSLPDMVEAERRVRRIYGYGRPIDSTDERNAWMLTLAGELGLDRGPHLALAFGVETALLAGGRPLRMNYAALAAALLADLGFSRAEFQLFWAPVFLAGMPPCYLEAAERPEGLTFPLACGTIHYEGMPDRRWPHAQGPRATKPEPNL